MLDVVKELIFNEDGSEIVELCYALPLMVFVCAMIVTFSQIIYAGDVALNAADAGARVAVLQDTKSGAASLAHEAAVSYLGSAGMGVSFVSDNISCDTWSREELCTYNVVVTIKTAFPMKLSSSFGMDSNYTVSKNSVRMIEKG